MDITIDNAEIYRPALEGMAFSGDVPLEALS